MINPGLEEVTVVAINEAFSWEPLPRSPCEEGVLEELPLCQ